MSIAVLINPAGTPPPVSQPTATKKKKSEFAGVGALVQGIGLLLILIAFVSPLIVGAVLFLLGLMMLIAGGRMAIVWKCSECAEKVQKDAKICAHCGARFVTK